MRRVRRRLALERLIAQQRSAALAAMRLLERGAADAPPAAIGDAIAMLRAQSRGEGGRCAQRGAAHARGAPPSAEAAAVVAAAASAAAMSDAAAVGAAAWAAAAAARAVMRRPDADVVAWLASPSRSAAVACSLLRLLPMRRMALVLPALVRNT